MLRVALGGVLLVLTGVWAFFLARLHRAARHLPSLDDVVPEPGRVMPTVSVVCAVKDEAALIGATLLGLLAIGEPVVEIIVVDDRSSDGTHDLLRALAARHPALRVVRIDSLPDGWLGKVHALEVATRAAEGDVVLYADAELELDRGSLEAALALMVDRRLDHLAVLPRLHGKPYFLDVFLTTALSFYIASNRPWLRIEDRPTGAVKGVGKLNVVRRRFLRETPGFAWLKMDIADDVALAQLVATHGGRSLLVRARHHGPALHWYRSVTEMVRRLEKNTVGVFARYRLWRAVAVSVAAYGCLLLPIAITTAALVCPWFIVVALAYGAATLAFARRSAPVLGRPARVLLGLPLGLAFMGVVLLRSSIVCALRGGIVWGATFYPVERLRTGQRVGLSL